MKMFKKYGIHLIWVLPIIFFFETSFRRMAEPDLFFYYALVENYLKTGIWPTTDPFLYTLPNDVLMSAHQWLGYWIYYIPYLALSWAGPILLKSFLAALILCIPLIPFWRKKLYLPPYFALVWTFAIFISHHRFRERVSLIGDLFIVSLIFGLFWLREKRWFWYSLPPIFLVWAQLHPSWPLALVILAAYFCTQPPKSWQRHELVSAVLCAIAPVFNPLLIEGYFYPFIFAKEIEPYLRQYVVEWLPLTDVRLVSYRFLYAPYVSLVPFIAWRLWTQRKKTDLFEWFVFVLSITLTTKSVRFGLVATGLYLLTIVRLELREPLLKEKYANNILTVTTILILGLTAMGYKLYTSKSWTIPISKRLGLESEYFPIDAVDFLTKAKPKMNVFNSFGFGGYLSWRWQGEPKIYFHGFSTNFKFYEEYYNQPQMSRQDLDNMIRHFNIGIFLISKLGNDNPYIQLLNGHKDFQLIYNDKAAVIFAKKDPRVFQ